MKRNPIIKISLGIVLLILIGIRCSEIPEGFIPDTIFYVQDPFNVQKGVIVSTAPPNVNGASYPLFFELLESIGPDGNPTTILTDSVPTVVWTAAYDFATDKSIEDIYAKLDTVMAPVMQISDASGQIMFTAASTAIPAGQYKVSVKMSNSAGVQKYENVFTANITDGDPYWTLETGAYSWNSEVGSWNGTASTAGIYEITHNPSGPNQIHYVICDKNGSPFSWADQEIINRGESRAKMEDVCFDPPVYSKDRATFKYPFAPFPFAPGGKEQYTNSYRIQAPYVKFDDVGRSGFINLVFGIRVFQDGEWTMKVTFPTFTRIPK